MGSVIAKETMENAYSQVLFLEGREYQVVREFENKKGIYVLNELHSETPVKRCNFDKMFIVAQRKKGNDMYRLKVKYKGRWKLSQVVCSTYEEAVDKMRKLKNMGVSSKLCDNLGKEISSKNS